MNELMTSILSMKRAGRVEYFLMLLLVGMAGWVATLIMTLINLPEILEILVLLAVLIAAGLQTTRRLHDINRPGWHYFLLFVPAYNLWLTFLLTFKAGDQCENNYGPEPYLTEN